MKKIDYLKLSLLAIPLTLLYVLDTVCEWANRTGNTLVDWIDTDD